MTVFGTPARAIKRPWAFCTPIAAAPIIPHTTTGTLLALTTGVTPTPARQNASSSTAWTPYSKTAPRLDPPDCVAFTITLLSTTPTMNAGNAISFITTPWPKPAAAAPISTKLPVTCAVKSPKSATKLSVST